MGGVTKTLMVEILVPEMFEVHWVLASGHGWGREGGGGD